MKTQVIKGHAEMRKPTNESVENSRSHLKAEIRAVKEDRQHFVESLAVAMKEVNCLRGKYEDFEEWEKEGEEYAEDGMDAWYDVEDGDAAAAGVSSFLNEGYMERVRRVAAPLTPAKGSQSKPGDPDGPKDILWTAKKAAQDAANAASDTTHNAKAYEQLSVPAFPKNAEMTNWMYFLATAAVVSGCYGDDEQGYMASGMLEQIF